jgi:hypothetical protein
VGSGLENHGKYGELIYAHTEKDVYVNLFIPSTLNWKERGLTLSQTTKFPYEENTQLKLSLKKSQEFSLKIRYPMWVNAGQLKVLVNGKEQPLNTLPSTYISITRKWKSGDQVQITLPMHTQLEFLPDSSSWGAILHGPIVLSAATESEDLTGLKADASRMGHVAEGAFYPIEKAPLLVNENNRLLEEIKKIPGESMTFTASSVIYPERYKNVKLVPFFTVHDSRYMIYWKIASPENLTAIIAELQKKEQEQLILAEQTIDYVVPGEQQPEIDHNMQGESTEAGSTNGQRWRIARGWLSYDLKNKDLKAKTIRVTYPSSGRDRRFDILVNERIIKTLELENSPGEKLITADYALPEDIVSSNPEIITIKFVARLNSSTGRIFEVRLLK